MSTADGIAQAAGERGVDVGFQRRLQRREDLLAAGRGAAVLGPVGDRLELRVNARQLTGERSHGRRRDGTLWHQAVECRGMVEAVHAHRVVEDLAVGVDDRLDSLVQLGRETAVQSHLAFAEVTPTLERGEIDEAEIDRLLQFVGMRTGQDHGRDVRIEAHPLTGAARHELFVQARNRRFVCGVFRHRCVHRRPPRRFVALRSMTAGSQMRAREETTVVALTPIIPRLDVAR